MKPIQLQLPRELHKSFVVFNERGTYFPCPWHFHPEFEFCLVTKSTGRRMVGDHIGYFEDGDLVLMGPMLPHVWVNDPVYLKGNANHEADAIVVHFTQDFLGDSFFQLPEMEDINSLLSLSKRGMTLQGHTKRKISSLMKNILNENGVQRLVTLFSIFEVLSDNPNYELLSSPVYDFEDSQEKEVYGIRKVVEYIMKNFDENIDLSQAASIANMGITTFCNTFKKNHRLSFIEYLNKVRIGHACKLLEKRDHTIAEIAYTCGYNTLAHFNRQFKKFKKMTPSSYLEEINLKGLEVDFNTFKYLKGGYQRSEYTEYTSR